MLKNFIFKIRALIWFLRGAGEDWRREIWDRDLDGQYCCDGRECMCGGLSVRETYSPSNLS